MFPNLVALFPEQALALTEYRSVRLEAAQIGLRHTATVGRYGLGSQPSLASVSTSPMTTTRSTYREM